MKRMLKKSLSLLLALVIVLGMVNITPPASAAEPVTLAAWNATTAGDGAVTLFPATSGATSFADNKLTLQTASGAGSFTKAVASVAGVPVTEEASGSSWAAWSQTVTADMYWRLELRTQGYENVKLTFHAYGTSTSPASWEAKYSTDGITYLSFSPAKTYTIDITDTPASATSVTVNLSVLDDASGAVYVGLFATTAATDAAGNNRLCNVKVTGDPVVARAAAPTANPAGGATVADGSTVTLSCATAGADIYYTTDGSTPTESSELYSSPIALDFGANNTFTIKAIAVASGFTDSAEAVFTYTKETVISIAAARARGTGNVIIEGVVTRAIQSSATNTTNCTVYIQDGTGGIAYYSQSE